MLLGGVWRQVLAKSMHGAAWTGAACRTGLFGVVFLILCRDDVAAGEPAVEVDVAAARRADRAWFWGDGGFRGLIIHGGSSSYELKKDTAPARFPFPSPLMGEDVFGIPAKPLEFTKEFFEASFSCILACILFRREAKAA
jgi:hypothetical protein